MYPPPQPGYPPEMVEQVRQQRIRSVKRRGILYGGLEVAFTAVFAALLAIYIRRDRDEFSSRNDEHWFRWYIGLLIGLLVLNALFAAYTIWQTLRTLSWLRNPNTPPELIMAGYRPESEFGGGRVVYVQQQPTQPQGYGQYYQPPPPMYQPGGGSQYPPPPHDSSYGHGPGKQ
ncbi:hypothetical protein COEREDRAFT_94606 [Coemansia reversa NRRL 1564]|uniref:Uncharacterized protein n=1 Tax=Coemansia reversa (strain ATCC 12441 / NRRL 1564) TaxID=763665 RepID=A0A2G5B325_COERN|nr:hypothetical protein COEREDRAFT_94606 [Coemansia reversa NRRL 1564]|eukprot:PIA13420.1 hypothetical protein COEREDRAFT_94606 [Coemansia reversa NRRL 1564]